MFPILNPPQTNFLTRHRSCQDTNGFRTNENMVKKKQQQQLQSKGSKKSKNTLWMGESFGCV